jgi:hypothetical protein
MEMCRFQTKSDEGYRQILGEVLIIISDIQRGAKKAIFEKDKSPADLVASSPSQTTASTTYCR